MKLLLASILVLFAAAGSLSAQFINIFDVDDRSFPQMKAKFFVVGANKTQIENISQGDLKLEENGITRSITSITCPPPVETQPVSSVLTIDISGSMWGENQTISKEVAKAWVDMVLSETGECAVTAFGSDAYQISDFSDDKDLLKTKIDTMGIDGGTNYDAAFLAPIIGALDAAKKARYDNKVIIFLSDGAPNFEPNVDEIVRIASDNVIRIFCVVLKMNAPQCLIDISRRTGGMCFERVMSLPEGMNSYINIFLNSKGISPCEITWQSNKGCDYIRNLTLEYLPSGLKDTIEYRLSTEVLPQYELSEMMLYYEKVCKDSKMQRNFTIKCKGDQIQIDSITTDDNAFRITGWGGSPPPFTLKPGDTRDIKVEYAPHDSDIHYGQLHIASNSCFAKDVYLYGYCKEEFLEYSTLHLLKPNGGETLIAGTNTTISWEGLPPGTEVDLEFSSDSGKTWIPVVDYTQGPDYRWKVPDISSTECLMKARKANPDKEIRLWNTNINEISLSHDGKKIAILDDKLFAIIRTTDGKLLKTILDTNTYSYNSYKTICLSPDGKKVAVSGSKSDIFIWNTETGAFIKKISTSESPYPVTELGWSPDGKYISGISADLTIWDAVTGDSVHRETNVFSHIWTKVKNLIVFQPAASESICLLNTDTFTIDSIRTGEVRNVSSSSDGKRLFYARYDFEDPNSKVILGTIDIEGRHIEKEWSDDTTFNYLDMASGYSVFGDSANIFFTYRRGYPYKIYIHDCNLRKNVDSIPGNMQFIDISDDNRYLAFLTNNTLFVYDRIQKKNISNYSNPVINGNVKFTWNKEKNKCINNNTGLIYSVNNYEILPELHLPPLRAAEYLDDGAFIGGLSDKDTVYLFNASDYKIVSQYYLNETGTFNYDERFYSWSPNGKYFAYLISNEVKIVDLQGMKSYQLPKIGGAIAKSLGFSPDSRFLAVSYDSSDIVLWDYIKGNRVNELKNSKNAQKIKWSRSGKMMASYFDRFNDQLGIWNTDKGVLLHKNSLPNSFYYYPAFDWSPDDRMLAVGYAGDLSIHNIQTKATYPILNDYSSGLCWVPVTNMLLYVPRPYGSRYNFGSSIRMVSLDTYIQSDLSDSVWTIVSPLAQAGDIDMGMVNIGRIKDSVIKGYIKNMGTTPVLIDSICLYGNFPDEFSLASGLIPCKLEPGQSGDYEFRFKPKMAGNRLASVFIYCRNRILIYRLKGVGTDGADLDILDVVDFGRVGLNTTKDSLVLLIRNNSQYSCLIDSIYLSDGTDFNLYTGIKNQNLEGNGTIEIRLAFNPRKLGYQAATLYTKINGIMEEIPTALTGDGIEACIKNSLKFTHMVYDTLLKFIGSATLSDTVARLSRSRNNDVGAVWSAKKYRIDQGFTTEFAFRMNNASDNTSPDGSYPGADGIAFVMQNSSPDVMGMNGGGIGYSGIMNCIAIEFDTFKNDSTQIQDLNDPNGNHIAIQTGYSEAVDSRHEKPWKLAMNSGIPTLRSDGTIYYCLVEYTPNPPIMKVWLDTTGTFVTPVIEKPMSIPHIIGLEEDKYIYAGFTSATGKSYQDHDILNWTFCSFSDNESSAEEGENGKMEFVRIYPNPSTEEVYISLPDCSDPALNLVLSDPEGKIISDLSAKAQMSGKGFIYSVSGLAAGIYYIKYSSSCGENTGRIVVTR